MPCNKAIVVHAGRRDYYQLVRALDEADLLHALVNDTYPTEIELKILSCFFNDIRSKVPPIKNGKVLRPMKSRFFFLNHSFFKKPYFNRYKDKALSLYAGKMASKKQVPLFAYSYYAYHAFRKYPGIPHKLLFQLHPHPRAVRDILSEESYRSPQGINSLMFEHELNSDEEEFSNLCKEPGLADAVFASSTFTANTLKEKGISPKRIHVVPYGIDTSVFYHNAHKKYHLNNRLNVIFVGSFTQRKGLSYLFSAMKRFPTNSVHLSLAGRGFFDKPLLKSYGRNNISVHRNLPLDNLIELMHASDVFVLPSVAEGFGHVILEAMATGLPVITTNNTCGPDVIDHGKNGFIIPIRDSDGLSEYIQFFLDNPKIIMEMGRNAESKASKYTWASFRQGIIKAYRKSVKLDS